MQSPGSKGPLALGAIFAALIVLGAVQGNRLDKLRRTEVFYRWLVAASTQVRLSDSLEPDPSADPTDSMDDELFAKVVAESNAMLPDYRGDESSAQARIVRAADLGEDDDIWRFASSKAAVPLRAEFFQYLGEGKLQSAGSASATSAIYSEDESNGAALRMYSVSGVGISSLFFNFRKVAANFLWLQVDKYWHEGQFHRMVPLMRTCVTLDPSFVEAYLLGAWHLAYNITAKLPETPEPQKVFSPRYNRRLGLKEEWYYSGVEFLKDGVQNNPRDYRLYFDLGYAIYETKLSDHENAIRYLREATRYKHDVWVRRMLYLSLMRNGQYEEAISGWKDYLAQFPENKVAPRSIQLNEGYLAEELAQDYADCAEAAYAAAEVAQANASEATREPTLAEQYQDAAAKALAVATEMEEQASFQLERARGIWTEMAEKDDDPLARARLHRMDALEYRKEGRYLEAISELQVARWETGEVFEEMSNLVIEIKQEFGVELRVSEKLAVQREKEAAQYRLEPEKLRRRRVECPYLAEEAAAQPAA